MTTCHNMSLDTCSIQVTCVSTLTPIQNGRHYADGISSYSFLKQNRCILIQHYDDVIMTLLASQITSLTVVYSTVYSDADQSKHQSSASLAFVWGIHRDRWIPRTKGQLRGKCFHLMTSSWISLNRRQANTWITDALVYWCMYAALAVAMS